MTNACGGCGHVNREGRRFCAECGQPLTTPICPACGASNEVGEKFCGDCGAPLAPSPDPAQASSATVTVAGEKKHITVLFADVAGSMDLQERLDAEVWAQIMGRFVSILAEGVRRFGGTVDKFTGDGIMALFGAPVAQEDHARRACHAAWYLTKAIGEYSEELRQQGVELHVRLGLNSGEVVVGRVGEDVRLDPTALGHTVGLAQRMEAMAEPGRAYLTKYTARLVEDWFRLDGLGAKPVKGARDPLPVYVLGPPSGAPVRQTGAESRLVGRERELVILNDALTMAMEGHAQVVGVVGEAGVGKSRLCDEFAEAVMARGVTVRRAAGLSHGKHVPLLPILALQRDYFGISEADSPEEARTKIAERLVSLDPKLEEALPLAFDFLEVPDPHQPIPPMAPEVRMRRILDMVRRMTARRSERETLVLVFEDLHWFDPQSEVFLERLIESYPGSRTLVVANFRPEFSARWMRHSYYRQLPLSPLPDSAVDDLLGGLLGSDLSLAPLLGFIQERTGGNPFFVEEVVRALVEDGTLAGQPGDYRLTRPLHDVKVPPNVQAVLAARIDHLPPEHKAILQTASVIGRTFSTALLVAVRGSMSDELEDALASLCAAEMLQEVAHDRVTEYRFWHPLTQEVAYGSLLSDRRRQLHAAVAEALEAHNGDHLDELAAVFAWHWERAGRHLEAARWNMRAGSWALRRDLAEATRKWQATLGQLATVEESPESLELGVRARIRLIQFGARTGIDPNEAEQIYTEARTLAERLGDASLLAGLVMLSGSPMFMAGDLRRARARYAEGIRLLEALPEPGPRAGGRMAVALVSTYTGPLAEGIEAAERGLKICADDIERGTEVVGYSVLVRILQLEAYLLALAGRLGEATSRLERALSLARPRPESENLAWSLASSAQLAWLSGDGDDSLTSASEALSIAEQTGDLAALVVALEALTLAHLQTGRPAEAAEACERALAEARGRRSGLFEEGALLAHLARARLAAGDSAGAISAAGEAVAVAQRQGAGVVECLALLVRGQVRRATGRGGDAEVDLGAALVLVKETGALTYEPMIREELARLHSDDNELRKTLRVYKKIGAVGHGRRLEAELAARPVG